MKCKVQYTEAISKELGDKQKCIPQPDPMHILELVAVKNKNN